MGKVPSASISALYANTTSGLAASPTAMDAAIADIIATIDANDDDRVNLGGMLAEYIGSGVTSDTINGMRLAQIPLDYFKTSSNTWDDALSAAFDYFASPAAPNQGGVILLGPKVYELSPFTMQSRVSIVGMGKGISILKLKDGSTGNFITFTGNSEMASLKECTIYGNKSNCPSSGNGIHFESMVGSGDYHTELHDKTVNETSTYSYTTLDNVAVVYCKGNGIQINSGAWGSWFRKLHVNRNDGIGLLCWTTDNNFESIWAEFNGLSGIVENAGNNRWSNIKTIFNGITDSVNSAGIKINNSARSMFVNVECQDNHCDGIQIVNSNGFVMDNVVVDGNGRIYNQPDPTDGSFAGNAANTGIRVTNSQYFKIRGSAANYKAPSCYIQNNACIIDSSTDIYVIDLVERYQYTTSAIRVKGSTFEIPNIGADDGTIMTQPLSYFATNSVTHIRVSGGTANTPGTQGGILTTYNISGSNTFSYQEFKVYNKPTKYHRQWNGSAWGAWTLQGVEHKTATINAGVTSVVVTHFLGYAPTVVIATPKGNVGNVWVSSIGSSQFTINCSAAPGSNTDVSWFAV